MVGVLSPAVRWRAKGDRDAEKNGPDKDVRVDVGKQTRIFVRINYSRVPGNKTHVDMFSSMQ